MTAALKEVLEIAAGIPEQTEHVRIWFLASLWPDCVGLVQFNRERNRLRLPTLTEAVWH